MPNKKRQLTYSFRHKDYHQCQTRRDSSPTASGTRTIINSRQEETAHRQLQAQGLSSTADKNRQLTLSSTADKKRQLTYSFRHKDYHQQQTRTDSSHYHQQQTRRDSSPTTLGTRTIYNSRQEETAHLQLQAQGLSFMADRNRQAHYNSPVQKPSLLAGQHKSQVHPTPPLTNLAHWCRVACCA